MSFFSPFLLLGSQSLFNKTLFTAARKKNKNNNNNRTVDKIYCQYDVNVNNVDMLQPREDLHNSFQHRSKQERNG